MSLNLTHQHSKFTGNESEDSLKAAARALWGKLLSVTYSPSALIRYSAPIHQPQDFWRIAAIAANVEPGRFFWQDRNKAQTFLGLGIALDIRSASHRDLPKVWQRVKTVTAGTRAKFFGGLGFADQNGVDEWCGFDAIRLSLPLVEISKVEGKQFLSAQLFCQSPEQWQRQLDAVRRILAALNGPLSKDPSPPLMSESTRYLTSSDIWQTQVEQVLSRIRQDEMAKVVLARATEHQLPADVTDYQLAERWQTFSPQTYTFLMNFGQQSFLGFSPERLLRQRGQEFATESLAGTQPRGKNEAEDRQLETFLMQNHKLKHEHQIVTDYIASRIAPYSRHCVADAEVNVLKLPNVQHRQAGFRGRILKDSDFPKLLLSLFPTPAVCGLPKRAAYFHILEHEQFQRGWYAGAVGFIGAEDCEFSVSIRSALLQQGRLISFAGAGIVEGSEAESEWTELNDKASILESILR
jgi:menaquinone-specific isochorismate synthase